MRMTRRENKASENVQHIITTRKTGTKRPFVVETISFDHLWNVSLLHNAHKGSVFMIVTLAV